MTTPTWFITGISSGLGRHLAEQVLDAGGRVAGTVRRVDTVVDLQQRFPDRVSVHRLDVTDLAAVGPVVDEAFARWDRIDVVVNNAGYGLYGTVEELTLDQIRQAVDTNLVGAIAVVRAALPHLRRQGGGRLLQMSSYAGQATRPGVCLYNATKWGIEGFTESIAKDVAGFGVEVTIVEPGGARTDFHSTNLQTGRWLPDYDDTPAAAVRGVRERTDLPVGDPARMAERIIASTGVSPAPLRLVLGSDAYRYLHEALSERLADVEAQAGSAPATDAPAEE
ncbi:Rossmann-fold NAD(P)-binding domain-containing protein [Jatrophihabitans fulvus]